MWTEPTLSAGVPVLAGCGATSTPSSRAASAIDVVATTPVVADFVRGVGGDKVAVTQILKPGVDPHEFEPSATDLQTIAGAALVVKSGVNLERWLDDTIKSAGYSGEVVDSSKGVAIRQGNGDEGAGRPARLARPPQRQDHGPQHRRRARGEGPHPPRLRRVDRAAPPWGGAARS